LVALRYRNFRLLWTGRLLSVAGSMMQNAVIPRLVPRERLPNAISLNHR